MTIDEVLASRSLLRRWVAHEVQTYGFDPDAVVVVEGPDSNVRVVAVGATGVLDLTMRQEGPRSFPIFHAAGKLHPWRSVGDFSMTTTTHPPQPDRGYDDWTSDLRVAIPSLAFAYEADDHTVTGLADFARAWVRRLGATGSTPD